jgi:hypothetical protein
MCHPLRVRSLHCLSLPMGQRASVRPCACCVHKWVSSSFLCRTTLHAVCGRWTCVWVWVARCRVVACTIAYLSLFLLRLISLGERRRTPTGTQAPCHSRISSKTRVCEGKNGFFNVFSLFLLFYSFFWWDDGIIKGKEVTDSGGPLFQFLRAAQRRLPRPPLLRCFCALRAPSPMNEIFFVLFLYEASYYFYHFILFFDNQLLLAQFSGEGGPGPVL